MQAADKIQLDAIDQDFQEAPEYFSTLPWVVRVMGRGAVANQISSNVPSTSGAMGIGMVCSQYL